MTHATEDVTDPHVFRLRVSVTKEAVVLGWDYPGSTLLIVRVQRSTQDFADSPEHGEMTDKRVDGQTLVFDGIAGSFRDTDVEPGATYYYTVWARHADERPDAEVAEEWVAWGRKRVRAGHPPRLRMALARLFGRA